MESIKDYYSLLGVGPTADTAAIKAAFRRLAQRYHPDVARDKRHARRFPAILEAYEALSDPEQRRQYDRVSLDRKPAVRPRRAGARRLERDSRAGTGSRRFGLAIDVLGLRIGLAVDAEVPRPSGKRNTTGPRNGHDRSER
jgi:curved DNA-binding protein CbpA